MNNIYKAGESLLLSCIVAVFFLPLLLLAQSPSASNDAGLRPGIVIDRVDKNFEGDKAGLREGDVLLRWSRGDAQGDMQSPFVLFQIEVSQKALGPVVVDGLREGERHVWTLGPGDWRMRARPNLAGSLLAAWNEGVELAKARKMAEAAKRWQSAASQMTSAQPEWLRTWFLFRAADMFAEAHEWNVVDEAFAPAVAAAEKAGPEIAAQLYRSWGEAFRARDDEENAAKYYQQALAQCRKMGQESMLAAHLLSGLGAIANNQGDLAKAQAYYEQALALREKLAPGTLAVAGSYLGLGNVAADRGALEQADQYYSKALELFQRLTPDSLSMANCYNNLALNAYDRSDLTSAEIYFQKAIALKEKLAPGSMTLAGSYGNYGLVIEDHGDLVRAEAQYLQALAIQQKQAPNGNSVANTLTNLGNLARERGDLLRAEDYQRQALAIREKISPGSPQAAANLGNLGNLALDAGELDKAEDYLKKALAIQQKRAPDSLDVAKSLGILGNIAQNRGDLAQAEKYYRQSQAINEKLTPGGIDNSNVLDKLGELAALQDNVTKAEENFRGALAIREKIVPGSTMHAESLAAVARVLKHKQQNEAASELYKQALDGLDHQAARLGGSSDVRSQFRAKHAEYYKEYADILIGSKQPGLALETLERSRARTLLETLAAARVDVRQGVDADLLSQERALRDTVNSKSGARIRLLNSEHTAAQVKALEQDLEAAVAKLQELQARIRSTSPGYAALTEPQPLSAKDVQNLLDSQTLLLEYALGPERSYVIAVNSDSISAFALPKRDDVETAVRHLYGLVTARNLTVKDETAAHRQQRLAQAEIEFPKAAASLSRMVLGPVSALLKGKRLLVVADGALYYVPFNLLPEPASAPSGATPLVVNHEVINLPSATVLAVLRRAAEGRTPAPKAVAVLADPVFEIADSRVHAAQGQGPSQNSTAVVSAGLLVRSAGDLGFSRDGALRLPRLLFTRQEAEAILAVTPPGAGMQALDFQADRATATSADLAQYRIVHFATHGLLNSEHPELSGLVFSLVQPDGSQQDGFVQLQDIYNLKLSADLVVLSACESGLGKEVSGEGLVGLTRGFMYAGATRVVASLWNVSDVATARLMADFYKAMEKDGMSPAAALRTAQLSMWKQKRWSAPYYWAAFQIQGEWK
jgi:CHAT domain-containing protein/Tfp pilus assembly protein PilF